MESSFPEVLKDTSRLCIHTITTKPWSIEIAVKQYALNGVRGITVWRDALEGRKPAEVRRLIEDAKLEVVSLCRGGFFPSTDKKKREEAIEDNKKAIDEAAEIGAPVVVLVCGSDCRQSLSESRKQIEDGIVAVGDYAGKNGVRLAIEPLHPMYADTRSAVNTLKQANDICEKLNLPNVGVAVDVYHIWWEPDLEREIARCGEMGRIFAFHVCDWKSPTMDLLLDRGLMGEGCIPVRQIRAMVEEAGFRGFIEVEIFSTLYWSMDQNRLLDKILEAYYKHT
ncbi:MAG: sugar phosphate isomerase/epimerase [Spirochaetes bacterium]|nr:MAG: sugar phosphate isomerase/epimerase [Spirochaetota bacterium]